MKHAPGVAALLAAVLMSGCTWTTPTSARAGATSPPTLRLYALQGRALRLGHAVPALERRSASASSACRSPGDRLPLPPVISMRNQATLDEVERLYDRGELGPARAAIEPVYRDEPANPFVLEAYARVLYRQQERAQAFNVYRQLVTLLDEEAKATDAIVAVDLWFIGAYWNLGTLHVDRGEWDRAAFEISRALAGDPCMSGSVLVLDQALTRLSQAFYEMGNRDVARYYAEIALARNPRNAIARGYLDKLGKPAKTP